MIQSDVAEQLYGRLPAAARLRQEKTHQMLPEDFDQFIKGVDAVTVLAHQLSKDGVSIGHFGMALDYYSAAIRYMISEEGKQDAQAVGA